MEKKLRLLLTILLLSMVVTVCIPVWADSDSSGGFDEMIATVQDLNGQRIGVQTGTTFDEIITEALPKARISYFNTYSDMAAALEANKIDTFPGDKPVLRLMVAENNKLARFWMTGWTALNTAS